jgi:uncharacterized protein
MRNVRSFLTDLESEKLQELFRTRILPLLVLVSLGLFLALAAHATIESSRVHRLTIAAGSKDGESYQFAQVLAEVVARYESKIRIEVLETPGTTDNLNRLQAKQVQLAMAQADIPAPPSAQLVSLLFPDMYQLVASERSNIQSVPDLRNKRVALPPLGGGQYKSFQFLAEHYGLNSKDPLYTPMPDNDADQAFLAGKVDAVFHVRSAGNQSILELVRNNRGRLVPIEQAAAMRIKQPALAATVIPKGTYQGTPPIPDQDQPTVAVWRLLLASKEVDETIIQQLTAILYERRQDLVNQIPIAASISPPSEFTGTGLPIHPGAQAYYDREKPSFLEANAEVFNLLLSLAVLSATGFWQLKLRIEQKRKDKADDYIQEVMAMVEADDFVDETTSLVNLLQQSTALPNIDDAFIQEIAHLANIQSANHSTVSRTVPTQLGNQAIRLADSIDLTAEDLKQTLRTITQRARTALDRKQEAQANRNKNRISKESLQSFELALQIVVDTVAWAIAATSTHEPHQTASIEKILRLVAKQFEQEKDYLPRKIASFETPQSFRADSTKEIRRVLDVILKRAVNALIEERVSQESFQSFRTVWQIAVNEIVSPELL